LIAPHLSAVIVTPFFGFRRFGIGVRRCTKYNGSTPDCDENGSHQQRTIFFDLMRFHFFSCSSSGKSSLFCVLSIRQRFELLVANTIETFWQSKLSCFA
jgi:hypothetical protein